MSTPCEGIRLQAERHGLVPIHGFRTLEEYCLYLIHLKAYEIAAEIVQDKIVLDCGCNIGYGTKVLSTHCKEVVGIDVSPKAIKEARRRYGPDGLTFYVVDGNHLPFKDGYFDVVVSFQVIEHINDYTPYLTEIKRVLRESGIAVFTTPNAWIRIDSDMRPFYPFHVREFRADELVELLQEYFSRIKVSGLFGKESLYAIEYQRVQRSREKIRRRPQWINSLSYYLRAHLPERTLGLIRTVQHSLRGEKKLNNSLLRQYSTADLFYRNENLNEALDLLAVCYNEDEQLR